METRALAESRFFNLMTALKFSRKETIGLLVLFWHDTQERLIVTERRKVLQKFIDVDAPDKDRVFDALLENDYLAELGDGTFEVKGNRRQVSYKSRQQERGSIGGKKSGENRRKSTTSKRVLRELKGSEEKRSSIRFDPIRSDPTQSDPNLFDSIRKNEDVPLMPSAPDGAQGVFFDNASSHGNSEKNVQKKPSSPPKPPVEATRLVWEAYSTAYRRRYGVEPVRNASVNGQVANLVKRLGGEAPDVAAFYVFHNSAFYVRSKHSVGPMLRDAEGLRTEWATGTRVTDQKAREVERMQTNSDNWDEAAMVLREKGGWK